MKQLKRIHLFTVIGMGALLIAVAAWVPVKLRGSVADEWKPGKKAGHAVRSARVSSQGDAASVAWMSIDDAAGRLQKEQKPVLIDLYTSWCGWCKQMDKKTYSNKAVAAYLQEKFYPVRVDAETKSIIKWNGKSYSFSPDYRVNEFAVYLAHGQLEFPTTVIIPAGGEPQAIPGYMEPRELELLVKYFGEGKFGKISFEAFQREFKASW